MLFISGSQLHIMIQPGQHEEWCNLLKGEDILILEDGGNHNVGVGLLELFFNT